MQVLEEWKRLAKQPKIHSFFQHLKSSDMAMPWTSRALTPAPSPVPTESPSITEDTGNNESDAAAEIEIDSSLPLDCPSNDKQ